MEKHEMDVFGELIKHEPGLLSRPIEELSTISFIGAAAVAGYRSLIGRLDSLHMTEEQKAKTLADGQDAGKMLLAIEGRIGELIGPAPGRAGKRSRSSSPDELNKDQAYNARVVNENPDVVAEVIAEAEENEDIPTKTAVINKVRLKKETERRKKAEGAEQSKIEVSLKQAEYINSLERIVKLLPKEPPKEWNEAAFSRAQGIAKIITSRLEVFNGTRNSIPE